MKISTSNIQDRSSFQESKKSDLTESSEDLSKRDLADTKRKKPKKVEKDPEEEIGIRLSESNTQIFFSMWELYSIRPSFITTQDTKIGAETTKLNAKYEKVGLN